MGKIISPSGLEIYHYPTHPGWVGWNEEKEDEGKNDRRKEGRMDRWLIRINGWMKYGMILTGA